MANIWGNSDRFYFLGLQNHWGRWLQPWIKRHFLLGRKVMNNLDSILKSRDVTLATTVHDYKVRIVKAVVLSVVMYGCESRTMKKAECWRTDAFKLWCWRRPLRVPWTTRRSNQSVLKEINPDIHWKDWCWSSNTLATWCEEPTHWKRPWCWKRLRAGEGDNRGWDGWMASLTQWTWVWVNSGGWWWTGRPGMLQSMGSKSWIQFSNWTATSLPNQPPKSDCS